MATLTNAKWDDFDFFKKGKMVTYNSKTYLCLVDHKRLANKPPHKHPFWAVVNTSK